MKSTASYHPVWDLPVRLFHWLLVALLIVSWVSIERGNTQIHEWSGLSVLTLVVFRVIWGFVGSYYARFSQFLRGPGAIRRYLSGRLKVKGHNPLGGWSVIMMLLLLFTQAVSGLVNTNDIDFEGPLYTYASNYWVEIGATAHAYSFNILMALVFLHVGAVVFYRIRGKNLIKPMITGYSSEYSAEKAPESLWLALLSLLISVAAIWGSYVMWG